MLRMHGLTENRCRLFDLAPEQHHPMLGGRLSDPSDEPFELCERLVVGHLPWRMLAESGGWRVDWPSQAAVEGDAGAADQVDRHTCTIGRILDGQAEFE